jgi:hypothetical protein
MNTKRKYEHSTNAVFKDTTETDQIFQKLSSLNSILTTTAETSKEVNKIQVQLALATISFDF